MPTSVILGFERTPSPFPSARIQCKSRFTSFSGNCMTLARVIPHLVRAPPERMSHADDLGGARPSIVTAYEAGPDLPAPRPHFSGFVSTSGYIRGLQRCWWSIPYKESPIDSIYLSGSQALLPISPDLLTAAPSPLCLSSISPPTSRSVQLPFTSTHPSTE